MHKPTLKIDLAAGEISFQDDVTAVAVQLAVAASCIYFGVKGRSKIQAEVFKATVQAALRDDSPMWTHKFFDGTDIVIPMGGAGDEQHDIH